MPNHRTDADPGYAEALRRIEICREAKAQTLDLRSLRLTALPPEVGQLTALTSLDLAGNGLTALPQVGLLVSLTSLDLADNGLTALPPEVGRLTALTSLDLAGNRLMALPPEVGQLTALTSLNLAGNRLTALRQVGRLTALTSLDLSSNRLTALPPEVGQLTALTTLDLADNGLTALPPEVGLLDSLISLNLSGNGLTALPPEVGLLDSLTSLNLAGNQLMALPLEVGLLASLTSLDLSGNGLTALPPEVGQLTALTSLDLADNGLTALPPEVGHLPGLTSLDLAGNRLTALPPEVGHLAGLKELYLHRNPNSLMPPEILGPDRESVRLRGNDPKPASEIIAWYLRNSSAAVKRPILEAKVILIGWGAVGKTSLRRRLTHNTFNQMEETTHKIEITPWPVHIGSDRVKLHVWDFGGQEIMHATHQFFLTKRSLYALVLAGREKMQGAQDAEYWLRLIKSFGGNSPAIVVLNKQRECPFDLNRQSLTEKYPFIHRFIETDCADPPLNLKELEARILQEIDRLPELRREFDANWMAIKDEVTDLKQKGRKRMAVSDYYQLCRAKQEPDPQWQKWLLGFLHDLGIVVCFHEDHRLANDGVLDPQWVVDGIYRVLTEPSLKGGDGRVSCQRIRELLPNDDYSDDDVRVLIELMEKFQLCFRLPESRTELVLPELMMEQEARWKDEFPDLEKCLRFELKYDFLPEGLMPRFIVATHDLSRAGERWRSGVILRMDKNAALVRSDAAGSPPLIRIAINGPQATRRELLAIIRREFEKINGSITGLLVQERVPVPGLDVEPLNYDDLVVAEAAGKKVWPIVVKGAYREIPLNQLLDGIEPREKRQQRAKRRAATPEVHLHGDYVEGDKLMIDDHSTNLRDNYGQVGHTLTNCTNTINQQPPGERKSLLETLDHDVRQLLARLPDDKKPEASQVAENLEMAVKQVTSDKPNRKWYSVSAEGLLEASKWVKDFTGNLAGTLGNLGKAIWPDFKLPESK